MGKTYTKAELDKVIVDLTNLQAAMFTARELMVPSLFAALNNSGVSLEALPDTLRGWADLQEEVTEDIANANLALMTGDYEDAPTTEPPPSTLPVRQVVWESPNQSLRTLVEQQEKGGILEIQLQPSENQYPLIDFSGMVASVHSPRYIDVGGFDEVRIRGNNNRLTGIYGKIPSGMRVDVGNVDFLCQSSETACVLVESDGADTLLAFSDCKFQWNGVKNNKWGIHAKRVMLMVDRCQFEHFTEHGVYGHSLSSFSALTSKFKGTKRTGIQLARRGVEEFGSVSIANAHRLQAAGYYIEDCVFDNTGPDGSALSIWGASPFGAEHGGVVEVRNNSFVSVSGGVYIGDEVGYNSISHDDKAGWATKSHYNVSLPPDQGLFTGPDADQANSEWKNGDDWRSFQPYHKRWGNFPTAHLTLTGNSMSLASGSTRPKYSVQGAETLVTDVPQQDLLLVAKWNVDRTFLTQEDVPTVAAPNAE